MHKRTNGRKSKCNTHVKSLILKEITNNGKKSTRKLAKSMSNIAGETFSHTSMKNYLNNMNIFSYNFCKKPDLEPRHVIARYEASKEWLMIPENDIKKIAFSAKRDFTVIILMEEFMYGDTRKIRLVLRILEKQKFWWLF